MKYLELNENDVVVNIIIWNGVDEYTPVLPSVRILPCSENPGVSFGWKLVDNEWVAPPSEE